MNNLELFLRKIRVSITSIGLEIIEWEWPEEFAIQYFKESNLLFNPTIDFTFETKPVKISKNFAIKFNRV